MPKSDLVKGMRIVLDGVAYEHGQSSARSPPCLSSPHISTRALLSSSRLESLVAILSVTVMPVRLARELGLPTYASPLKSTRRLAHIRIILPLGSTPIQNILNKFAVQALDVDNPLPVWLSAPSVAETL